LGVESSPPRSLGQFWNKGVMLTSSGCCEEVVLPGFSDSNVV
jgi:hypothetical protein